MRTKLAALAVAGVLGASGVVLAGPALAAVGAPGAAADVTSRVDRVRSALAGLVGDGTLTQEQADKVATTLGSSDLRPDGPGERGRGNGRGNGRGEGRGNGRGDGRGGRDLSTAATALGIPEADLRTALKDGRTLAQIAEDRGVPVAKLVDALVAAERTRIADRVKAGDLTQARADERLAGLVARVTEQVHSTRPGRGRPGDDDQPSAGPSSTPRPGGGS